VLECRDVMSKGCRVGTTKSGSFCNIEEAGDKRGGGIGHQRQTKNYLYTQSEPLKSTPILAAVLDVLGTGQAKTLARVDIEEKEITKR